MENDNTKTDVTQTGVTVEGNQDTDTTTGIAKQSDSDFMSDTVDFIKNTQKIVLGDEDGTGDDTGDDTQDGTKAIPELAGKDIPDSFSDTAEAAGMTPAEIVAFADGHTNEELLEMIPYLQSDSNKDDTKVDDKVAKQDDKTNDNKTIDAELEARVAEKIAKQLEEKFGASLEEIEKFKVHQKEQADRQTDATVSKIFDDTSKEFPVFGKTDELPKFPSGRLAGQWIPTSPAMKARLEVLRHADYFMKGGLSIDESMGLALATYKGQHLTKELERNMVKSLKGHEQKLGGARVGRETKKKYADTRDEIIDDIRQMQRQSGIA